MVKIRPLVVILMGIIDFDYLPGEVKGVGGVIAEKHRSVFDGNTGVILIYCMFR